MKKIGHIYPWRENNQFELLIDAEVFYPRMLQAIEQARSAILLEMYLFESGHAANEFIEVLIDAARRGVKVQALLDDFGCRKLSAYDRHRLQDNGVELRFYNPVYIFRWFEFRWLENLARDHRKLLLIDGQEAFIGGAGITDEFLPQRHKERAWRETMVSAHGPVVKDWCHLFRQLWPDSEGKTTKPSSTGNMEGRLASSTGYFANDIRRSVVKHIRSAEQRVWFCTAYFVP
ncbi:MAG: phosphatidylserine/phosphatidylglycerophosphate/cardiolipin synthase family protein, partial [Proteobacteria bacterium]|nr:phosphatidylserine/phosphatidylglycerophosphate/cardiolipin synthase family protein [Pseudomonadota bacterium]